MFLRSAILAILSGALATLRIAAQTPPVGPEFFCNSYTTLGQFFPSVAMGDDGGFVVVWNSVGQNGDDLTGIIGRRFDFAGQPLTDEFPVNTYTTNYQASPVVALQPSGFVVAWVSQGQDGEAGGIFGRRFDATGNPLGGEFPVNTTTASAQLGTAIAADAAGNFVVVWQSDYQDGSDYGIVGRRFDASAAPLGGEFAVNTHTTGRQETPSVAADGTGRFVVAWESDDWRDGSGKVVVARAYDSAGSPVASDFLVAGSTVHGQYAPSVAADAAGDFVVVWTSTDLAGVEFDEVVGRRLDASGNPVGEAFAISTDTSQMESQARVAMEPEGQYVVAWQAQGAGEIRARLFDVAEGPTSGEFRASDGPSHPDSFPTAAIDGNAHFTIVWGSYGDGSQLGVAARLGEAAAARNLTVDAHAPFGAPPPNLNGVIEPGENVQIEPRWRNTTASPLPLAGTAVLSGNAPGSYLLVDGAAGYGLVAVNDTADCFDATGDCYVVSISGPRPAPHWDATLTETLPFGYPLAKTWVLHVGESFPDEPPADPFYEFVESLFHHGVTGGCGGGDYCPGTPVTRAQMAVFLLKSKYGSSHVPPACSGVFGDVACPSPFADWIEQLAAEGITGGCGNGDYCPSDPVTRQQMAAFLLKTRYGSAYSPPACAGLFGDVACPSLFADWIEDLYGRQITGGCQASPLLYCPTNPNTRGQMAVFLVKTFGLDLYGP